MFAKVFVFLLTFLLSGISGHAQTPSQQGTTLGNQAVGAYGTKSSINSRMANPLMSSDTQMSTLDGTKQFSAQMLCPSSKEFLKIFVQPLSTGDLGNMIISQDTDYDGTTDASTETPFNISGVCANGIISCTPAGTWNTCQYYRWTADSSGKASLAAAEATTLGGCYCINNSCGSNLSWTNLGLILKDLGGGAAMAIQARNARRVIADVRIDGTMITYYGQDSSGCTSATYPGYENPQQYFSNPYAIEGSVGTMVSGQYADPGSNYNVLLGASQNVNETSEIRTCIINKTARIIWSPTWECNIQDTTSNNCTDLDNNANCTLREETVDGVAVLRNNIGTGLTPLASCRNLEETKDASCEYACPGTENSALPCMMQEGGLAPTCEVGGSTLNCEIITPILRVGGPSTGINETYINGIPIEWHPAIQATGSISTGPSYCHGQNSWPNHPNACDAMLPGNTACWNFEGSGAIALKGVKLLTTITVGGAALYDLKTLTGKDLCVSSLCVSGGWTAVKSETSMFGLARCPIPAGATECIGSPPSCIKSCAQTVCKDWWRKDRKYFCRTQTIDLSDTRRRTQAIKQSATKSGGSIQYTDLRKDSSGNWISEDGTIVLPNLTAAGNICEKACKTKKVVHDTQTMATNQVTDYRQGTHTSYEYLYRVCRNNTCPVGEGETIVKDCQCINEFAEASILMQTLRMGGEDTICSSGTKRVLQ